MLGKFEVVMVDGEKLIRVEVFDTQRGVCPHSDRRVPRCLIDEVVTEAVAYGLGTVFKLDTFGHETVMHSFNGSNGWAPYAGLIMDESGNLYGTTGLGGTSTYCNTGCGTVFKLDTAGQETVIHSFTGFGGDGFIPQAALVRDRLGNLYGTTSGGGAYGGGIVFKIDTSGHETVLHSFTGNDLAGSYGGTLLMDRAGNLYGTSGGGGDSGDGTVFKIRTRGRRP